MSKRPKRAGVLFAALLFLSGLAVAQDRYGGSMNAKEHGYQHGYRDGLRQGRYDRSRGATYSFDAEDYRRADGGYQKYMGEHDDFQQGYRSGYKAGYDDGYSGQFALTLSGSILATIQIGSLAATRTPIPTGIGATRMLPLIRVIEMDSRPDRTTCGSARTIVRINTTRTRMPTTVIEGTTATRINSRNNIGRDLFVVTRMLSTGWNVKIDEQPA